MNTVGIIVRESVKLAANFGIGHMTGNLAVKLISDSAKLATKVCCGFGAIGVAGAVGMASNKYIDELADDIDELIGDCKDSIKKRKEEKKSKKEESEKDEVEEVTVEDLEKKLVELEELRRKVEEEKKRLEEMDD